MVNKTIWLVGGGWGWAGLSEEHVMEGGGWVAMVMRAEHARSPLGCTPAQGWGGDVRGGGRGGGLQYYLLLLDMAY